MQKLFVPSLLVLSLSMLMPSGIAHADTDISGTSPVTLTSGETASVASGKSLADTHHEVVVTVAASSTLNNSGTISDTNANTDQNERTIRITNPGVTFTLNNNAGATITTADADVIQEGKTAASVTVTDSNVTINNKGTLNSQNTLSVDSKTFGEGQQAIDLGNDTSGTVVINNYSTGLIEANDSDAIQSAANATISNDGKIYSFEPADDTAGNDGIDAQANSGVKIINAASIGGEALGSATIEGARHGITGGNVNTATDGTFIMSITNNVGGTIQGDDGSGVNIDGFSAKEVVTIVNAGTISGTGKTADGDGVDVDGMVNLTNTGTIESFDAQGDASEGVTVGGGTIINSGLIEGKLKTGNTTTGASGVGITLAGVDNVPGSDPKEPITPPLGIYGNTTIDNQSGGQIIGAEGAAIQATGLANSFTIGITNEAGGLIEGSGSGAAIALGGNDDTINDSGVIKADTSGAAVDMGGGTNHFEIDAGSPHGAVAGAEVDGSISGGSMSTTSSFEVNAGSGQTFTYSGAISNFTTLSVASGTFNYGGTITGGTMTIQSGGTLSGNNTVGMLVVATGGTLSPGNSPGIIHAGNTTFQSGGNFLLQVDNDGSTGAAGTNWDQLAVTGTLDISALATAPFNIDLQSLTGSDVAGALGSFDHDASHIWTDVITTTAGTVGTFSTSDFAVNSSQFAGTLDGSFSIQQDATNANDFDLVYTAIPEPSTWALMLGGAGALAMLVRSRVRREA